MGDNKILMNHSDVLLNVRYVVAPMVDGSELAWRILSRRYGAELAYSPMINSKIYLSLPEVIKKTMFSTIESDRPMIVQLCGNDPDIILQVSKLFQDQCDGIDINLGCPQGIAKRGNYGAFLQEDIKLIESIVNKLDENLKIPVSCKIRVLETVEKTVSYALKIQQAGCKLLTVHGRERHQKGQQSGLADWDKIKAVKNALNIPVFANGNILYFEDIQRCMEYTGVDGVMIAEGNLHNPGLFANKHPIIWEIASEYLEICKNIAETAPSIIRGHIFRLFRICINDYSNIRDSLAKANSIQDFENVVLDIRKNLEPFMLKAKWDILIKSTDIPKNKFGYKDLPNWVCQPYLREKYSFDYSKIENTMNNNLCLQKISKPLNNEVIRLRRERKVMKKEKRLKKQQNRNNLLE